MIARDKPGKAGVVYSLGIDGEANVLRAGLQNVLSLFDFDDDTIILLKNNLCTGLQLAISNEIDIQMKDQIDDYQYGDFSDRMFGRKRRII